MFSQTIIIGNLGKDPEIRHLDGGRAVASFSVATSEKYTKKDGEKVENTEWYNVQLWSPLAEIAEKYLKKGSKVQIIGKHKTRTYEKDGQTRYITNLIGRDLLMLGTKEDSPGSSPAASATASSSVPQSDLNNIDNDDL